LKEKGEISDVIRTRRGFEIIKLEDRIPATEKPLADVRDDIIKRIKERKALYALRGDLESVIRTAQSDPTIFDKFSKRNNLKAEELDWVTKEDGIGHELNHTVIYKMFTDQRKDGKYGYFVHQASHILYVMADKKESYIPEFADVRKEVEQDLYEENAKKLQEKEIRQIKQKVLEKNVSLSAAAKEHTLRIITTKKMKKDDTIEELKKVGGILHNAFALHDSYPLLEYSHEKDKYLIRLVEAQASEKEKKEEDKSELIRSERESEKHRIIEAFIASLKRNATIEKHEEMLKIAYY